MIRFRAQALRHYEQGERVDEPLRLASVPIWIGTVVLAALLATALAWSLLVRLPVGVTGTGVLREAVTGWQAELFLPLSAVAPIRPGQQVSLTLRSVPASTYGTLSGRTVGVTVGSAAGSRAVVRVALTVTQGMPRWTGPRPPFRLRSGMPVRARVVVARPRAIRWVLPQ
jgi:hypothetical protein